MSAPADLSGAFQPLDPEFVQDPWPILHALREREPVHRSPMGHWVLTRHADVVAATRDPRLGNAPSPFAVVHERNAGRYTAAAVANRILPFLDPPRHDAPRRLIGKAFHAQLRERPPALEALAVELLDAVGERGELELLEDLARPFALRAIGDLLGVPRADLGRLEAWSRWFFYLFSAIPSQEVLDGLNGALDEFRDYMGDLVQERRRAPREDLLSRLVHVREGAEVLGEDELIDTALLLFADGVENVDSGIASSVLSVLRVPGLYGRLRGDRSLVPAVVDESLRIEPPGQFIAKIAREDLELGGHTVRRGHAVLLVLAAANRDPEVFEEPDSFRLDRPRGRHLAFGKGRHACLGAPLVLLQMEAAWKALLDRYRALELLDAEPRWQARLGHRWLERLPLAATLA